MSERADSRKAGKFWQDGETVKTVKSAFDSAHTPLKRGVNKSDACETPALAGNRTLKRRERRAPREGA